jgi:formate dehydrogenase alpha subunit
VLDGKVIGVIPSKENPVSRGRVCVKGLNCWEVIDHPDRLRVPLVRKNGRLKEAPWDEALDLVATRLAEVKRKAGPDAFGMWGSARHTNEMNYLAMKFARAVMGTNNVDHCARTCHSPTVAGLVRAFGSGAMTNSIEEIASAAGIFAIGSNATEAHPLIGWRIRTARENGAQLIVCDPRRTDMAAWADIHIQHYPGSDIELLNALMNVIISEGLYDKPYVEQRCEGFDELWETVRTYTPERAGPVCGVAPGLIRQAARLHASRKPVSHIYTLGITEHTTGTENVMSVANLAMITGNVGIESGGVNPLRGQNNVQGACDMGALPDVYHGYQRVDDEGVRAKFQKAWGVALSPEVGLTVTDQIIQAREGKVKALYIIGEDPMRSDPNLHHVREALDALDFLVVHELFLSPTAEMADVVLPVACFAEDDGTFTNSERRVQRIRQAVDLVPGTRKNSDVLFDVARRLGAKGWEHKGPSGVWDELAALAPLFAGIRYDRLEKVGLQWPCPDPSHPGTPYLHKDRFTRGLGKLHAIEHRPPAEVPDEAFPFYLSTGRIRFHYNVGTMTRRSTLLDREFPRMFVQIHPADAAAMGIRHTDKVRVSTRRGELVVAPAITDRVKPGVLWMPFHFTEAPANLLTNDAFCPIARTGEYKVCAAKVEKA